MYNSCVYRKSVIIHPSKKDQSGFTLIELSIVLVIIGLIVGGVLVGRDLINAAAIRAQIAQIEKYQTAVNTFRGKYGYLPGDIKDPEASNFGFQARGQYNGEGDGNGIIEGTNSNSSGHQYGTIMGSETAVFWNDLATARLTDYPFNANFSITLYVPNGVSMDNLFPGGKIGNGNYVYVWSGGPIAGHSNDAGHNGLNYFGLSAVVSVVNGQMTSNPGLTVQQAASIDAKIDDGFPQGGNVTAMYLGPAANTPYVTWAGTTTDLSGPWTSATPASSTTCFDNGNAANAAQQYSLGQSGGANVNCALSFRFQ